MNTEIEINKFPFQLDEFYLDLQQDGSKISLLTESEIISKPFPGLRPFKTSEFQLFRGRDGQAEELIKRLKKNKFLAVIGSSGTGKSSLVRAGLLPQLFGGYLHEAGNKWKIAICRPGKNPITNLSIALSSVKTHSKEENKISEVYNVIEPLLNHSIYGILEIEELLNKNKAQPENLLLIIDQFEELFRFDRKDFGKENIESHFVNLLLKSALNPNSAVYVIITMRSEFLGDCIKYRGLPEAINEGQYLVPQLSRNQLKEVIEGPLYLAGKKMSPQLVEILLNEIEQTKLKENLDQLPILQHALMRTYNEAIHDPEINYEHYKKIGGMEKALANHAESKYEELGNKNMGVDDTMSHKQRIAKIIFQALTDLSTDQKGGRRPTELKVIYKIAESVNASEQEVNDVINHFRSDDTSFIMPPINTALHKNLIMDISHESLMRNWEKLNDWIKEELNFARLYRVLNERRELYEQGMDEFLRGGLLKEIIDWGDKYPNNAAWASRYHNLGKIENEEIVNTEIYNKNLNFLSRSQKENEVLIQKEKERIEDEIKRTQKNKSTRLVLIILGFAVAMSTALTLWALDSRNNYSKKTEEAKMLSHLADSSANEAVKLKNAAVKNERIAKSQAELLQKITTEATNQRIIADRKTKDALKSEEISQQQKLKAIESEKIAKKETLNAKNDREKAVRKTLEADKLLFKYQLSWSKWWNNNLLTKKDKDYFADTLFNLYDGIRHIPNQADSIKEENIKNSLNFLLQAQQNISDWGSFLYFLSEAKKVDSNYKTNQLISSYLDSTIVYTKKFKNLHLGNSIIGPSPFLQDSSLIIISSKGIYQPGNQDDDAKELQNFENDMDPLSLSNDCKKILFKDYHSGRFLIFTLQDGNKFKNNNLISDRLNQNSNFVHNNKKNTKKTRIAVLMNNLYRNPAIESGDEKTIISKFSDNDQFLSFVNNFSCNIYNFKTQNLDSIVVEDKIVDIEFNKLETNLIICFKDSANIYDLNNTHKPPVILKLPLHEIDENSDTYLNNATLPKDKFFVRSSFSPLDTTIFLYTSTEKYKYMATGKFVNKVKISTRQSSQIFLNKNGSGFYTSPKDDAYDDNGCYINPLLGDSLTLSSKFFPWHSKTVTDIKFMPSGEIISADEDSIYIWNINSKKLSVSEIIKYVDSNKILTNYLQMGDTNYNQKNYILAVENYKEAARFKPTLSTAWNMLGISYYSLKKYDSAINSFKMAINFDSSEIEYIKNLAASYSKIHLYYLAVTTLKSALAVDSSASIWYKLGSVYNDLFNYKLAINAYKKAYVLDSANVHILNALGYEYYSSYQEDSAFVYYNKAFILDSLNGSAKNNLALVLIDRKEYDKAIIYFNQALKYSPKDDQILRNVAHLYNVKKNYPEAIVFADSAIKIDSTNSSAYSDKGFALLKQGNLKGLNWLNNAIKVDSTDWRSYVNFAAYYSHIGDFKRAIDYLKTAVANGFFYYHSLEDEEWFANIRLEKDYIDLMRKMKARILAMQ